MRRVLLIALALLLPAAADAQKRCKKGIPCGGTCIAANKTCHVGTVSPEPTTPPAATAAPARQQSEADTPSGPWVASSRGLTYYRRGCKGARELSPANLISFPTEDAAKAAGYRHSAQRGC